MTTVSRLLSKSVVLGAGVPQGSILGPFFFSFYVNDLSNYFGLGTFAQYANDTSIIANVFSLADLLLAIATFTQRTHERCIANQLTINCNKTKIITFSAATNQSLYINVL